MTGGLASDCHPPAGQRRGLWVWAGWEPDRYYTRLGGSSTPYFGNGAWISNWRDTLESDETLRRLADLGATLLITQFFKGLGPEVERATWPRIRDFVERARGYDIKVSGYVQGHSLFGEFLFPERPEARDWVAKTYDGRNHIWATAYNRFAPCFGHEGYAAYIAEIMRCGLVEVGLDGFQLDNSYAKHCYCDGCKSRFRSWLAARPDFEERTGIPKADAVEPPPIAPGLPASRDPLVRLWIEFGVAQRLAFLSGLRAHIRKVSPAARLSANPAYMKSYASRLAYALDPSLESRTGDAIAIENGNLPRFVGGELFTQADRLLFAGAAGCRTMITSWGPGPHPSSPPQGERGIWALMAEEYSFAHCQPGNNWMLRAGGESGTLLADSLPVEMKAFREARSFFEALHEGAGERWQWGETCLYFDPVSVSLNARNQGMGIQTLMGYLLSSNISFRIVYPGQEFPEETRTVLLCEQTEISETEVRKFARLASARDLQFWLIGAAAPSDEWGVPRNRSDAQTLIEFPGSVRFDVKPGEWADIQSDPSRYFKGVPVRWKKSALEELTHLASELTARQQVSITAEPGVLANLETDAAGRLFIHLRDLDLTRTEARGVALHFGDGDWKCTAAHSPSWSGRLPLVVQGGELRLPGFAHYALLVLESTRSGTEG